MNVTPKPHLHQDWIDPHAIGIVRALQKKGFVTYLVGGCVRDLLLGIHPKDFDIATTAKPEDVRKIIHRSYVIGKRFKLVLVRRDEQQFEVATFRREMSDEEKAATESTETDSKVSDNLFGSPEEDARRRDFTINGLFYDPIADQLIDFAEGMKDLESGWVRMIGDPVRRLKEDPIRILRALRLKHMISFALEPSLRQGMMDCAHTLPSTVLPRRREELLKLLRLAHPELAFREAYDLGILQYLSPTIHAHVEHENADAFFSNLRQLGKDFANSATPGELFAHLVHSFVRAFLQIEPGSGRAKDLLMDEPFQKWMRDELGMFKIEQTLAVKALHIEPLLAKRKDFLKRGDRRQKALLMNEAFPLALRFAERDYCLSSEDLLYWIERYRHLLQESPSTGDLGSRSRRRRPRRRRSGGSVKNVPVRS